MTEVKARVESPKHNIEEFTAAIRLKAKSPRATEPINEATTDTVVEPELTEVLDLSAKTQLNQQDEEADSSFGELKIVNVMSLADEHPEGKATEYPKEQSKKNVKTKKGLKTLDPAESLISAAIESEDEEDDEDIMAQFKISSVPKVQDLPCDLTIKKNSTEADDKTKKSRPVMLVTATPQEKPPTILNVPQSIPHHISPLMNTHILKQPPFAVVPATIRSTPQDHRRHSEEQQRLAEEQRIR